jgi:hypothetical protein
MINSESLLVNFSRLFFLLLDLALFVLLIVLVADIQQL